MKYKVTTCHEPRGWRRRAGFTLAEVLAALTLMAIVIPAAVQALRVASAAGAVAVRRAAAARVAERVLNERVVLANWTQAGQNGTVMENGQAFRWTLLSVNWPEDDAMRLLTTEVTFPAEGRDGTVRLSTLVNAR